MLGFSASGIVVDLFFLRYVLSWLVFMMCDFRGPLFVGLIVCDS
jgi:hypothetical protein